VSARKKEVMVKSEEGLTLKNDDITVERVQIGVRIEKRMVKVLKGLAEFHDISLGDLLEGIVLHAFENTPPFDEVSLECVRQLKEVYGMEYGIGASNRFVESKTG
jgi:hypothetical protein